MRTKKPYGRKAKFGIELLIDGNKTFLGKYDNEELRDEVLIYLNENGIPCTRVVYVPTKESNKTPLASAKL